MAAARVTVSERVTPSLSSWRGYIQAGVIGRAAPPGARAHLGVVGGRAVARHQRLSCPRRGPAGQAPGASRRSALPAEARPPPSECRKVSSRALRPWRSPARRDRSRRRVRHGLL
jgi:hypothetical protein